MPPGPFHATQGRTHIILLAHLRLRPFQTDTVIAGKRLHRFLVVGPSRQHFLADDRLAHDLLKEMDYLSRPGQAAQITVDHHTIKTVVYKEQQAAKQPCERLHRPRCGGPSRGYMVVRQVHECARCGYRCSVTAGAISQDADAFG